MEKGNVLVIGNSGVGKSTLINTVIGEERAFTSSGTKGTTTELRVYENDELNFRLIDTVGFEPTFLKSSRAISSVQKWSKKHAAEGGNDYAISVIWFCVDGTSSKLFDKTIKDLTKAVSMWKDVPIIVAITKSYSEKDRKTNIELVNEAFENSKIKSNVKDIIPVIAQEYKLKESDPAPDDQPLNIIQLIEKTVELMPEGMKAGEQAVKNYIIKRKRIFSQGIVGSSVIAGATVGAVPLPIPDAGILVGIEGGEVKAISKVWGISDDEKSSRLIIHIIELGTVSMVAKQAIQIIKAIPGLQIVGAPLNALVAAVIVSAIGESASFIFEKIYLGEN